MMEYVPVPKCQHKTEVITKCKIENNISFVFILLNMLFSLVLLVDLKKYWLNVKKTMN